MALISLAAPSDNFVDRALPLYASALAVIALLEGRRFGDATLAFALPVLGVARIAVFDENLRILIYGVILAAVAVSFAARVVARFGRLSTGEGVALVAVCVAAMKLVPFSRDLALAQAAAIAGVVVLGLSLATRDGLGAGALLVCLAAGLATPLAPTKAALFPVVLAAALVALRGPSPFSIAALAGSALLAGRWSWPLAALVVCVLLLEEVVETLQARRPAAVAFAAAPLGSVTLGTGALAAAAFSPESIAALARLALRARVGAVALAAAGLVLRPSLGALYMVAALAILLTDESRRGETPNGESAAVPLVAASFAFAMLALLGYSGAVASRFPLPLPVGAIAIVAVVALVAMPARRMPGIAVTLSAAALVATAAFAAAGPRETTLAVREVLAPGESWEGEIATADEIRVELAGGNLTALLPGTPVGTVEAFDRSGRGVRRDVVIGEVADWGLGRPGHYFAARNEWPRWSGAKIAEYGHEAFLGGSGTVTVELPSAVRLKVTAAPSLPAGGRLHVDSVTVARR